MESIESSIQGYRPIPKLYNGAQIKNIRYILDAKSYQYELTLASSNGKDVQYLVSGKWVERYRPKVGGFILFIGKPEPTYINEDEFNNAFKPCEK